jgi:hypothetical protein
MLLVEEFPTVVGFPQKFFAPLYEFRTVYFLSNLLVYISNRVQSNVPATDPTEYCGPQYAHHAQKQNKQ